MSNTSYAIVVGMTKFDKPGTKEGVFQIRDPETSPFAPQMFGNAGRDLRGPGALEQLGRQGQSWFEHPSDRAVSDRPSEDERDAPLPRRRLRGRPD